MSENDHFNLSRQGSVRLDMKFAVALPHTVTVIVYAEFENVIEIDHHRNIVLDFTNWSRWIQTTLNCFYVLTLYADEYFKACLVWTRYLQILHFSSATRILARNRVDIGWLYLSTKMDAVNTLTLSANPRTDIFAITWTDIVANGFSTRDNYRALSVHFVDFTVVCMLCYVVEEQN